MTDDLKPGSDMQAIVNFLLGEDHLDGVFSGDRHDAQRDAFWWRKHLRAAWEADLSSAFEAGALAMREKATSTISATMSAQEWPPQDGDQQIDEVVEAVSAIDPASLNHPGTSPLKRLFRDLYT